MDFTYFFALGMAFVIGFIAAILFVAMNGSSRRKLFGWSLLASVLLDFILLINWSHVSDYPVWMFGSDLLFFVVYGLVGCAVGAFPVLLVRRLIRNNSAQS